MNKYLYSRAKKKAGLIFLLMLFSIISLSQTMFFERLNTTTWTGPTVKSEADLMNSPAFGLIKMSVPKDSLRQNVSLWTFRDSILTITNYDFKSKVESTVGRYYFDSIRDLAILQINFKDTLQVVYDLGIVSSGSFATLTAKNNSEANFITKIDLQNATKEGIYLNGYVVHLSYFELRKLNGKKVLISGKVLWVKGLSDQNDDLITQGRRYDTKHIVEPKIKF